MLERWRYCASVPEYIVSSDGRLMKLPFVGSMPYGGTRHYESTPIRGVVHEHNGQRPTIHYNGKNYRVSRLVCEAFHGPAPFPKAIVMHIDDNPENNRADNLKWGTQKENLNSESFIAYCRSRTGENSPYVKGKKKALEPVE